MARSGILYVLARSGLAAVCALVPLAAAAQAPRGAILFIQCRACHTLKAGEPNKVGPNLSQMFTRAPLSAPGFKYSSAFNAKRPVWTAASLDRWLERPGAVITGTSMAFAGMAKPADRAALIVWLQEATR